MDFYRIAWLIPILPLIGSFLVLFIGKRTPGRGAPIAILGVAASLLLSLGVFFEMIGGRGVYEREWHWLSIGPAELGIGVRVDGLASVMFVVVTVVSLAVHVYSMGYMHGDKRYTWYFAALSLFTGSMLNLVVAPNLIQLLVGWELVGICSYLLIGHWWEEKANSDAAIKAFITTKSGDVGFVLGVALLFGATHTFNMREIQELAVAGEIPRALVTAGAVLLFFGAIGKSAQFPLHVWLPDAMAGPTPVSALIHAATMVTAGVYMVARLFELFASSGAALKEVALVGAVTMLIAALLAMVQDDIKKVLAYSTISQLAYMMAGVGLGGPAAGVFHLYTQGFTKSLLFLGAGSLIHAVHSNNLSEMGGLRRVMPVTYATFLVGTLGMAGIPPLASFWSKDEIIGAAARAGGGVGQVVFVAAVVTAFLTAFYMGRALFLAFEGEYRGHGHPEESPPVMTGPLVVLAVLAAVAGLVGAPFVGAFSRWLEGAGAEAHPVEPGVLALSVGVAVLGLLAAWRVYGRGAPARDPTLSLGFLTRVLVNKYYLDDLYLKGIVRPVQYPVARAVYWTNQRILDGAVNGAAILARVFSRFLYDTVDQLGVDGAVNGAGRLVGGLGRALRALQWGRVQRYAAAALAGAAVLALLALLKV